ncbi:MAG TPA: alpha/beta hydrolase [Euzebyales bacterium]|nr:alpha/beta hydrolase [Euzebyales bacterium]
MQPVRLGHVAAGDGPTLVAVHGGLLSGRPAFGPVLADWAQRFRVLVPDRRGFELSRGAGGTLAAHARDLEHSSTPTPGGTPTCSASRSASWSR